MTHTVQRQVQPDRCDYRTVLTLQNGKVKEEANRLANEIDGRNGGPAGPVLLDFRNVEHVVSEDLGAIIGLHKRVKSEGGRLTLVNVRPLVAEVLSVTKLDTLFAVHRAAERPAANGANQ